jgi:hypothetical protein
MRGLILSHPANVSTRSKPRQANLTSDIPEGNLAAIWILEGLYIEADGGNCRDYLPQLQLVEHRGLSRPIIADDEAAVFRASTQEPASDT